MRLRFLLDTSVVLRYFLDSRKLARTHERILDEAMKRCEQVALSAITQLEIARLLGPGSRRVRGTAGDFLKELSNSEMFQILPITFEIATEFAALTTLRDPADRTIVATARVHKLYLLTSDVQIIDSGLADVVE